MSIDEQIRILYATNILSIRQIARALDISKSQVQRTLFCPKRDSELSQISSEKLSHVGHLTVPNDGENKGVDLTIFVAQNIPAPPIISAAPSSSPLSSSLSSPEAPPKKKSRLAQSSIQLPGSVLPTLDPNCDRAKRFKIPVSSITEARRAKYLELKELENLFGIDCAEREFIRLYERDAGLDCNK